MKKILMTIATLAILVNNWAFASDFAELQKGSIILVYPKKIITTATVQEGDEVYFISPADIWVNEIKIIPKNAIFVGYIDMLKMPIKGINAAFSVKINKLILPNGEVKDFIATLSNGKTNIIGGELTPPVSYNKTIHPYKTRWKWSGSTQWVPSGDYEFGRHTSVSPRNQLFVVLDEKYLIEN